MRAGRPSRSARSVEPRRSAAGGGCAQTARRSLTTPAEPGASGRAGRRGSRGARVGRPYQAWGAEESVGGLRVTGQAGVGAVLAELFDVLASVVGQWINRGGNDQRRWQTGEVLALQRRHAARE